MSITGVAPKDDISQVKGVMYFVTNQVSQKILFEVMPDDLPEGDEVGGDISYQPGELKFNVLQAIWH
jgi:hypothetical protein